MHKRIIRKPTNSRRTHCKTFGNCARGSDPWRSWNAAEYKCSLEVFLAGVSTKRATEQPRHLNWSKTQKICRNTLRDFSLYGFSKHLSWFRFSGKGKHLNLEARQNPSVKPLTINTLQDFQQAHPRYRSQPVLEHRRMLMYTGSTSERGIPERSNRTAQASEPEPNSNKPPQHIEKLSIAKFQQETPLVQMQR